MAPNGFTRAGSNGRLTLAVPSKGRMAEPSLRLCADAGLSFEATDRSLLVPCANAPVDLLLVREATSRSTSRTASSISGSPAPTSSSRRPPTSSSLPTSGSPAARCRRRCRLTRRRRAARSRPAACGDGLPRLDTDVAGAARDRRRARARLRFGRGCASPRPLRRDRRPRLDRVDGERQRPAAARCLLESQAVLSQRGGAPEAPELVGRLELMISASSPRAAAAI